MTPLQNEIQQKLRVPKTREGRCASILETVRAHPGHNLQAMIDRFAYKFGCQRRTVSDYFRSLARVDLIRVTRLMKVYPKDE